MLSKARQAVSPACEAAVGERHSPEQFLWLGSRHITCNPGCPGSCTFHLAHGRARRWQHGQHASPDWVLHTVSLSQHRSCCAMPCATVLLAVWNSLAAAGRGAWLGCNAPCPHLPSRQPRIPVWEDPVPHLPSLLPVPDLGVSQPQGPSVPDLALLIDRAGGCWASTPHHGPSLAQLSGCITSPTATHTPPALALLLPRVSLLSPLPPHHVAT